MTLKGGDFTEGSLKREEVSSYWKLNTEILEGRNFQLTFQDERSFTITAFEGLQLLVNFIQITFQTTSLAERSLTIIGFQGL